MFEDIYEVTISYWPGAVEHGVLPIRIDPRSAYMGNGSPGAYTPNTFLFKRPPTRREFLDLCIMHYPWTSVWNGNLFPLIDSNANQWPILESTNKSAEADIYDALSNIVGNIRVSRLTVWANASYNRPLLRQTTIDKLVNRLPKAKRDEVQRIIHSNKHRILTTMIEEGCDDEPALRQFMVEHKLVGRSK
jgi:hypothetical protein